MSAKIKNNDSFMMKMATFIVDKRTLFFLLYVFAAIFSIVAMTWVEVENDVTVYLPEDTETRQGIVAMNENFETIASARVMVSNVTYETATQLAADMGSIDGITMVSFTDDEMHYKDACALIDVTFEKGTQDPLSAQALANIRTMLNGYDHCIDTTVGVDDMAMLLDEMMGILIVAVIIIFIVLTLTSRAYMEVPVLLITFGMAALINMGTHFMLGKISFISNSVAVVLQLALAIDYAIILCHRFSDEHETKDAREACIIALSKAIPEISASSLTTIGGLLALAFMEFGIGKDMAFVLMKSIFMSLLSVFTLMPGLLVLFSPLIDKTRHKKLLPSVSFLGKFAVKTRRVLPPIFIAVLIVAFFLSNNCPFAYSFSDMRTNKMTEQQQAYFKIKDTFGTSNMVALLVPSGDYEAEAAILDELSARPEVKSTMGLSGIEALEGYKLTDSLNPRELSELIGMDYEVIQALYAAYAANEGQMGVILTGLDEYKVPLFDMFIFIKDQLESNNINLTGEDMAMMTDMFDQLGQAQEQMQNENYSRMVVYLNLPEESEETFAFLSEIREICGKYYDGDYYVVGNSTSSRDLSASFERDNLMITILSAFFVIMVLLFTFKSVGLPVLLIVVIQGSIWINYSVPTITETPLYFLGYLIVQAIQMGANIDYAIVISSHYQEKKAYMPHKEAIVHAVNSAFPTVFTSGTMMAAAGLLIGNMSAQPVIAILGVCIGRGTIISMLLVLTVLPSILVLGDSIINRTSFKLKKITPPSLNTSGVMYVNGRIKGSVTGELDGKFTGVIRGDINASVSTETETERLEERGAENE